MTELLQTKRRYRSLLDALSDSSELDAQIRRELIQAIEAIDRKIAARA